MNLDLGCGTIKDGEKSPEGYLRQDIDPTIENLDIVCDIRDLHKHVKPESCDVIRASHVMEHFPTQEIPEIFKMIYELIKPGGTFAVIVPNFRYHAALVLNDREEVGVQYAFGGQLDKYDFHYTAFTPNILAKLLVGAGFNNVSITRDTSVSAVAIK